MQEERPSEAQQRQKTKQRIRLFGKGCLVLLAALLVFQFGVGVGSGAITFSDDPQPEQAGLPDKLNYNSANQVYQALKKNYDGKLDASKLLDGMKEGLATATGDPYTEYFTPKEAAQFDRDLNGSFSGIGAELGMNSSKNIIIVAPIEGFPAQKAGLRAQDVIAAIDGKSTVDMTVEEAASKIRGTKGTTVTLKVIRDKTEELTLTITRADIKVPSVKSEIMDGNIGYLRITQFGDDTAELAANAAKDFKDKDVKGVVLDLRDNPGGRLDAAVEISSLWLPRDETVLQEKRGGKVINTYTSRGNDMLNGKPTVVLINQGSASASEIVAGALRDHNAATLIGVKSFGKGSVQQIQPLQGGAELKVTVARWYRPNGENIDKKGIKPNEEVKITDDDFNHGRDPQKDAALTKLR